jgi:hypothetical protein
LTIFPIAVWARKQIDKIQHSFFWKGDDNANGGHCLVNWATACQPKDLGGLWVFDLAKFSRALRLRWLWQEWTTVDKPWVGTTVPCNETDRLLFNASTVIHVGNGNKTRFWHHSWLDGEAPKNLAPHLFQLVRRKNKTVQQELTNDAWIETLRGEISTATQLQEFVSLWVCIQDVNLQPDLDDQIIWKWTNDGIYSNRSAYRAQFYGTYRTYKTDII